MMVAVNDMIHLDADRCYRAAQSRDERFDGWFYIAVRTTGIYCRPSCPAVTPKRANVTFWPTSAAVQQHGLDGAEREVRWLNELIQHERDNGDSAVVAPSTPEASPPGRASINNKEQ